MDVVFVFYSAGYVLRLLAVPVHRIIFAVAEQLTRNVLRHLNDIRRVDDSVPSQHFAQVLGLVNESAILR